MSYMNQPGIILLREGTDSSQGKAQLVSNINACQVHGTAQHVLVFLGRLLIRAPGGNYCVTCVAAVRIHSVVCCGSKSAF